jgi:hypothetical protein
MRSPREDAMTDTLQAQHSAAQCRPGKRLWTALASAAAIAAGLACAPAQAAPATLANDADVAAFAARVKAYAGASRVRWTVAAQTRADADTLVDSISGHLAPDDRGLISRVRAATFADNSDLAPGASVPVAWMAPQIGQSSGGPKCSWQVWVTDPDFPSAVGAVNIPLAPNDKLPVSPQATFRIGYTGLLQSKLYAFGETLPGDIRDLAAAPDVNIPVSTGTNGETILLAMARQPAPYLEGIRMALAANAGQRRELGKEYALRGNLLGRGRGIGANIQLVAPNMVVIKDEMGAPAKAEVAANAGGDLMETCMFSLTPAQGDTQ